MTRHFLNAALIVAAAVFLTGCNKKEVETVETAGPLSVKAETVKLDTLTASVTVTGTVSPSPGADWTITAPEAGRIAELAKAEGDAVKEGDLLVRFEVPSLVSDVAKSEAEVAQANARLTIAKSNAARLAGLFERGIASQRESDEAKREQQDAEAALGQAQSGRQAAGILSARTVIRARFAGVIAKRWHNAGDQVEAGGTVLRVIDPSRLEILASVPVAQLSLVGPGHAAHVFNPADASVIEGTVITVPPLVDASAATGDVRVTLPKAAHLTAGTPVQLEIMSDERKNVMVIPTSAVLHEGADAYVMVAGTDGKAHRKSIVVGLVSHERTQVASGLAVGDNVILAGPEPIPDGASITIEK